MRENPLSEFSPTNLSFSNTLYQLTSAAVGVDRTFQITPQSDNAVSIEAPLSSAEVDAGVLRLTVEDGATVDVLSPSAMEYYEVDGQKLSYDELVEQYVEGPGSFTHGADTLEGSEESDVFSNEGHAISYQDGYAVNTFGTDDAVFGNGGDDNTLKAHVIPDQTGPHDKDGMPLAPKTQDVQNVEMTVIGGNYGAVTVHADDMRDVERWASVESNDDLIIERANLNGTELANTEDVRIEMISTADSGRADMEVYFNEHDLVAGEVVEGQARYAFQVVDQEAYDAGRDQLDNYVVDTLRFDLNGEKYELSVWDGMDVGEHPDTHAELVDVLNDRLAEQMGELVDEYGLEFEVDGTFTQGGRNPDQIVLNAQHAEEEVSLGHYDEDFPRQAIDFGRSPSADIYRQAEVIDETGIEGLPVTSDILLDDVGRGSEGGNLVVGSTSNSESSTGVKKMDIEVGQDSNLGYIASTNGELKEVHISSYGDAEGDLVVREGFGNIDDRSEDAEDRELAYAPTDIDSTGLEGSLVLDQDIDRTAKHDYSFGGGGNDVNLEVSSDAAQYSAFELDVSSGNGDDEITLEFDGQDGGNWVNNQRGLDNVSIDAGNGDNVVKTPGSGTVNVTTGSGADVIYTDNSEDSKAKWVFNAEHVEDGNLHGSGAGDRTLLEGAQVEVTLSNSERGFSEGFEALADISTDSEGYATEAEVNEAIVEAINEDAVLSNLLKAEMGPNHSLVVESLIDGEFDADELDISINAGSTDSDEDNYIGDQALERLQEQLRGDSEQDNLDASQVQDALTGGADAMEGNYTSEFAVGVAEDLTGIGETSEDTVGVEAVNAVYEIDIGGLKDDGADAENEDVTFDMEALGTGEINLGSGPFETDEQIADELDGQTVTVNGQDWAITAAGTVLTLEAAEAFETSGETLTIDVDTVDSTAQTSDTPDTEGVDEVRGVETFDLDGHSIVDGESIVLDVDGEVFTYTNDTGSAQSGGDLASAFAGESDMLSDDNTTLTYTQPEGEGGPIAERGTVSTGQLAEEITGADSTADSEVTVDSGSGDDVIVLSTSEHSADTVVFEGNFGHNTIVNFNSDWHELDFSSYLDAQTSATESDFSSEVPDAEITQDASSASDLEDALNDDANSIINFTGFDFEDEDDETWSDLTANDFESILEGGEGFGIDEEAFDPDDFADANDLHSNSNKALVFVENDLNDGEYKVFEVATSEESVDSVGLVGTVDLGESLDFTTDEFAGTV
ncbi:hypothetical protein LRD18_12525 [Halorhodospira halochloris]|uniref:hypothetical protein n=1 Tax=Halorhodospira halochloris TaxID=1052 RepID=UPI001EE78D59|nr:hypothetical protein [Halorhodospira halochloris]MCG5531661.1 hypothetical protein [Halorhodospira halochloris]